MITAASSYFPAIVPSRDATPSSLEGACRALEREFATLVFQKMRTAMAPAAASGSSGFAREATQGMLDSQWGELASQGEGLGLWRVMLRQLEGAEVKSRQGSADEKIGDGVRPDEADPDGHTDARKSALPVERKADDGRNRLPGGTQGVSRGRLSAGDREGT